MGMGCHKLRVQTSNGLRNDTITASDCVGSDAAKPLPRGQQGAQPVVGWAEWSCQLILKLFFKCLFSLSSDCVRLNVK